ncbi:MAG: hypothetical protein HC915_04040 [Anaerolineae bacterium]|nr:hypothetical protein [Anaerolineae bacterium]
MPLWAQLWHYDADGVSDRGEAAFVQFVCAGEAAAQLSAEASAEGCQLLFPAHENLIFADRSLGIALLHSSAQEPTLRLDGLPLVPGATLRIGAETLRLSDDRLLNIHPHTLQALPATGYLQPYQRVTVQAVAHNGTRHPAGTPVLSDAGTLVGVVMGSDTEQTYFAPAARWLDALRVANQQIQSAPLAAVLARSLAPEAVIGAPAWATPIRQNWATAAWMCCTIPWICALLWIPRRNSPGSLA